VGPNGEKKGPTLGGRTHSVEKGKTSNKQKKSIKDTPLHTKRGKNGQKRKGNGEQTKKRKKACRKVLHNVRLTNKIQHQEGGWWKCSTFFFEGAIEWM